MERPRVRIDRRRLGIACSSWLAAGIALASPLASAPAWIFADGFALGNACRWSSLQPAVDCDTAFLTVLLPGGLPLETVRIPAGTYLMGSPEDERGRSAASEDLHEVTLTQDVFFAVHEVTQEQWQAVVGSPPSSECGDYGAGATHPVYCVSWNDIAGAGGFLDLLNAHLGATSQPTGFRLPTDAEWERAARAGSQTRFSHGDVLDCGDTCESCAAHSAAMWWCGDQPTYTNQPVASKQPNGFGLHDVHGNVWEWVQDYYQASLGTSPVTDPTGAATGDSRVFRGGGWPSDAANCRAAVRIELAPASRINSVGFRVARTAP